jgi:hypothetical protein
VVEVADDCTVQESSTFDPDISLLARYAEQTGGTLQVTMRPTGQNVLRWSLHV